MTTIGIFRIKESFNVTNRGIVAVGYFVEGRASVGSVTIVEVDGNLTNVKVVGIEMGNLDADGNHPIGLLLLFENKRVEEIVKLGKIKEQLVEIRIP